MNTIQYSLLEARTTLEAYLKLKLDYLEMGVNTQSPAFIILEGKIEGTEAIIKALEDVK